MEARDRQIADDEVVALVGADRAAGARGLPGHAAHGAFDDREPEPTDRARPDRLAIVVRDRPQVGHLRRWFRLVPRSLAATSST